MINKLDPLLVSKITMQSVNQKPIDCIVYSNNYFLTKLILNKNFKNVLLTEFPFIKAFALKLLPNQISKIANLNTVNYISSSLKVQTQVNVAKQIIELKNKQNLSHNFTCAVIDTGISPILDLCVPKNRIVKFIDFVNDKIKPYDDNGHGTFIASVMCGNGCVSCKKYVGIDENIKLIGIKALDCNGEASVINILKAMQWVVDNQKKYNIKLVCMSFGSLVLANNDPLILGAEVLWDNGVCVVAAAGNSGPESATIKSPGASSKIITVGAINDFRNNEIFNFSKFEVADFSSRGPILNNYKPDVVAPGVNINSACNFKLDKQHYKTMSGTSVATPIVAGVCSLLIAKNPNLKPNEIKQIILKNTIKLSNDRNSEGFGLVNCKNFVF